MNDAILSVKNLTAGYGSGNVLSDIAFDLNRGEILGIVGESGSGKSTLLKVLLPVETSDLALYSGEMIFENKMLSDMTANEKNKLCGRRIGMIFQNAGTSFNPIRTYRKQFAETLKSHGKYKKNNFEKQIFEIFDKLSLLDGGRILDSCPFEMSGGMNQRIAIALSVLLEPALLLADEPTSALDVTAQEQVMEELLRIRKEYGTSIILVTHNIGVAAKIADKVGVMYQGKIVEFGRAEEVLRHPENPYTKALLKAVPRIGSGAGMQKRNTSCCLLELEGVSKVYQRHKNSFPALSRITMKLEPGEILGIVGESGSGKSTLLKQIAGLQQPTAGRISFHGKDITRKRTRTEFKGMQMVFQNACESFNPKQKIRHSIAESLNNLEGIKSRKERKARIDELMEKVGLEPCLADRYPGELSGGQCQRAAIARAISVSPELLLCDEITSALDVSVQADIIKLLKKLAEDLQMAIIFVSHDIALVSNFCEKIMVMRDGTCIEAGETKNIIANPRTCDTKKLLASVLDG